MEKNKRIAAAHDLSSVGRCALTVAIPVLSSMGHQVCPLPTALLSTHPAGFEGYFFEDLTSRTQMYIEHWKTAGVTFDALYSGYTCTVEQITTLHGWAAAIKADNPRALVVVDPVMGDNGKKYRVCTDAMVEAMRAYVTVADVITPNPTEACLLLGVACGVLASDELLARLSRVGAKIVIITGAPYNGGTANLMWANGNVAVHPYEPVPMSYPGTGDIFASVLTGGLMSGMVTHDAFLLASRFTESAVAATHAAGLPVREGVAFEPLLPPIHNT